MKPYFRSLIVLTILVALTILLLPKASAKNDGSTHALPGRTWVARDPVIAALSRMAGFVLFDDDDIDEEGIDVGVTKTAGADTTQADTDLTFTIEVIKPGAGAAVDVTLNDPLPAGTLFVSLQSPVDWNCTTPSAGSNGTVTCVNPSLTATTTQVFTLVVHVDPQVGSGTYINNTATVTTSTLDPNDENNSSTASSFIGDNPVDVGVLKAVSAEFVTPGSELTYTLEVTKSGPGAAANVTLTDVLPGDMTFVSITYPAGWACTTPAAGSNGTIVCTNPSLTAASGQVFKLVAQIPPTATDGTVYDNTATVSTSTADNNSENDSALTSTTVIGCLTNQVVTTDADSGPGSLRKAIQDACPDTTINFSNTLAGPITLTSGELLIDKNLTIEGPGANKLTIQRSGANGTPDFRIFTISNNTATGPVVAISGLTIKGGHPSGVSPANGGGAIYNDRSTLTISASAISDNTPGGAGGGILSNTGTLTINSSTINGNTAGGDGGAIYNVGDGGTGKLTINNSTISGNTAGGAGGGGIFNTSINNGTATTIIANSTIYGNRATNGNGGGIMDAGSSGTHTTTINNTIVAGNFRGVSTTADDINGTVDPSSSYNLIGTGGSGGLADGINGNQVNVSNTGLGSLANNGGPTQTHALSLNSPAVDKGKNFAKDESNNPISLDQRGVQRPVDLNDFKYPEAAGGDGSDIGAFEIQDTAPSASAPGIAPVTNEDTSILITLTGTDAQDEPLSFFISDAPDHGTLGAISTPDCSPVNTCTATVLYTPAANYFGPDSFKFKANDGASDSNEATVQITVNPINDPPVADAQAVSTNEDTAKDITLTGSDIDTPAGNLTFIVVSNPAHGVLSGTGANRTYTPAANYNGPDSFTFKLNDGSLDSNVATVSITVNAVNDAPQATNDNYSTDENTQLSVVAPGVLSNDTDIDSSTLTAVVVNNPTHGTLTLNANGSFTYTPQPGFSGSDSFTYKANDGGADSNTATVSITVNEGGTLQFSSPTYGVGEGGGSAVVTITRTGGSGGVATVLLSTSNGTASSSDYGAVSTTVTFNPSDTFKTVNIPINEDALDEVDETVNLTLSNAGGSGQVGTPGTAVLTITDNDPAPSLSVNDVSVTEGNSGTVSAIFTVTLSAASGQTVTVDYASGDGTATTANNDFLSSGGTLTFAPGQTTKSVTVFVNGDTANEPDENYFVILSNSTNASISDNRGLGTIVNDDSPLVQLSAAAYTVSEDALRVQITVNRTGDISRPATVDYITSDTAGLTPCSVAQGKASERCDYATSAGTLRFAAGEASKVILIPIVNDVYADNSETFKITLRNPSSATLASPSSADVIITDSDPSSGQANPLDQNDFFIRQLYIDLLGREPEPAGLAAWLQVLNGTAPQCNVPSNCDRIEVASAFTRSAEFRDRGYFVYLFYRAVLGRIPHYAEFVPDMALLNGFLSGSDLEANKQAFVAAFLGRQEFMQKYDALSNAAFVDALLTSAGLQNHSSRNTWVAGLNGGTLTRAQVLRQFVDSSEVAGKFSNEALVIMNYFGLLRRDADASYQGWLDILNSTNDYRVFINGFINSPEYRTRFGQ